jgi:DNA-binding CsgD family transcriptional regulator
MPVLERLVQGEPSRHCVIFRSRGGRPVLMLDVARVEGAGPALGLVTLLEMRGIPDDAKLLGGSFGLTPGQSRVAALLADGLSVPEMAQRLGVAETTVRTQVAQARERLGLESQQVLAVALARALTLLRR